MQKMAEIIARDEEAILVELAEECAELAQAALKLTRIRCGRSPADASAALEHLTEELADVYVMLHAARQLLTPAQALRMRQVIRDKRRRMIERLGASTHGCAAP